MKIDVTVTWQEAPSVDLRGRVAVLIDVLRATSTIVTALHAGAERVHPVATVEEGLAHAELHGRRNAILGGERGGLRIDGYDLGNSPREYTPFAVGGKTVILTTTNGTRAFAAAEHADAVVAMAFLNVGGIAEWLLQRRQDVTIICAGTEGRLSLDDFLCAGMLISRITMPGTDRELADGALAAADWYASHVGSTHAVLSTCFHGRRLAALGFEEDLAYCAAIDTVSTIPLRDGKALIRA